MVVAPMPSARGCTNASSRLGPITPAVPASASTWQRPHLPGKSSLPRMRSPVPSSESPTVPQPAVTRAATRSAHAPVSARAQPPLTLRSRPGAERAHGRVARLVDREHAVEAGDLEDLRDVAVAADEGQLPVVRAEPLHAADQDAERRRVDEGRVRQVDDDVAAPCLDHLEQLLLELRRCVEVDLSCQRDHVLLVAELLGADVEVHLVSPVLADRSPGPSRSGISLTGAGVAISRQPPV